MLSPLVLFQLLIAVVLGSNAIEASATYPLTPFEISRAYDPPAQNWLAGHRGIDVRARAGQTVYAPDDAIVHFSGQVVNRGVLTLRLRNGDLISLEPVTAFVELDDPVQKGQSVGQIAATGAEHCNSAPCLHIGLRRDGRYLNPLTLWPGLRPSIVLLRPV